MPTRFVTNPGRPGRKPARRPAKPTARRSRKNPSSRRLGGVEAIYMGRVAGASRAVDGDGMEYKLDPEEVSEKGLRKGDAVIVRAVPGRFAAFRKTVARKNPAYPTLTVWSVSGSPTDRQLGRMFPTGWTRLADGHIATLASYANKVRGVSAHVVGTMPVSEVMSSQARKNPTALAAAGIAGAAFVGGVLAERRLSLTGQVESAVRRKKAEAEREAKRLKSRARSAARGAVRDVERRGREAVEDVKDRARRATRELRTARKNPSSAHLRETVEQIRQLTDDNAHTEAVEALALFAFPDRSHRMRKVIRAAVQLQDAYGHLPPGVDVIRDEVYKNAIQSIRREHGANVASQLAQAF